MGITARKKVKHPAKGTKIQYSDKSGMALHEHGTAYKTGPGITFSKYVSPGVVFGQTKTKTADAPEKMERKLSEDLVSEVEGESSDVTTLCRNYHLRREELGRLTGFSLRALAEWAAGNLPSHPAKRRLHEVRRLLDALSEIVNPESIPNWLHEPNRAFDRLTPLQVIELGEIDRLWAMVHNIGSGQPE